MIKNIIYVFFILLTQVSLGQNKSHVEQLLLNSNKLINDNAKQFSKQEKKILKKVIIEKGMADKIIFITTDSTHNYDYVIPDKLKDKIIIFVSQHSYYSDEKECFLLNFINAFHIDEYEQSFIQNNIRVAINYNKFNLLIEQLNEISNQLNGGFMIDREGFNRYHYRWLVDPGGYFVKHFDVTTHNVYLQKEKVSLHHPEYNLLPNNLKLVFKQECKKKYSCSYSDTNFTYRFRINHILHTPNSDNKHFNQESKLIIHSIKNNVNKSNIEISSHNFDCFPIQNITFLKKILNYYHCQFLRTNFQIEYSVDTLLKNCTKAYILYHDSLETYKKDVNLFFTNDTIKKQNYRVFVLENEHLSEFKNIFLNETKDTSPYIYDCFIPTYQLFLQNDKGEYIGYIEIVQGSCPGYSVGMFQDNFMYGYANACYIPLLRSFLKKSIFP